MKKRHNKVSLIILWTGRALLNAAIWLLLLNMLYNNNQEHPLYFHDSAYWWHIAGLHLLFGLLVYGNSFWLWPQFVGRKKYGWYLLAFVAWGILFTGLIGGYNEWLIRLYPGVPDYCFSAISITARATVSDKGYYYLQLYLFTILIIQIIFTPGWLVHYFFKSRRKIAALTTLQDETELRLLKAQIHPHFLFNVLNSIYALSLKKSDKTPEMVLRLSDCLRYLLYESGQGSVPLIKEIKLLEDYIAIEKIRLAHPENISLQIEGSVNEYDIIPALFLPFVENAVKHGFNCIAHDSWVQIQLNIDSADNKLYFTCRNSYRTRNPDKKDAGGIGLQNVRKRLALCYPDSHHLTYVTKNNIFEVKLTVQLKGKNRRRW